VLGFVLFVKQYFAPILLSLAFSWSVFYACVEQELVFIPLFDLVVTVVLKISPAWMDYAYTGLCLSLMILSAVLGTKAVTSENSDNSTSLAAE
jgi:hypothetical protein